MCLYRTRQRLILQTQSNYLGMIWIKNASRAAVSKLKRASEEEQRRSQMNLLVCGIELEAKDTQWFYIYSCYHFCLSRLFSDTKGTFTTLTSIM